MTTVFTNSTIALGILLSCLASHLFASPYYLNPEDVYLIQDEEPNDVIPENGPYESKDKDGNTIAKGEYKNGKRVGQWLEVVKSRILFEFINPFSSANWTGEGAYKDGKRHGPWIWKRSYRTLAAEGSFKTGQLDSEWKLYHADGKSIDQVGNFLEGKRTGDWKWYRKSGELLLESTWGPKGTHGESIGYHKNGIVSSRSAYVDGEPVGDHYVYDKEGVIKQFISHANGEVVTIEDIESKLVNPPAGIKLDNKTRNGIWTQQKVTVGGLYLSRRTRYVNGVGTGLMEMYYRNKTLGAKGLLKNDKFYGIWIFYYSNGTQQKLVTWENGKRNGECSNWRDDGTRHKQGHYADGKAFGNWKTYHEDGKILASSITLDSESKLQGVASRWHSNGKLSEEGKFKDNTKEGTWKSWYESGAKKTVENYSGGEPSGIWKVWDEEGKLTQEEDHSEDG